MQCVANATGEILSEIEPLYMLRAWLQGPTTSIEVAGGVTNEVYGHGFPQALASLESDGVTLKRRGCMALFVVLLVRFVC